jgi:hypothetical protein
MIEVHRLIPWVRLAPGRPDGHDTRPNVASQALTRVAAPGPDISTRSAMMVKASLGKIWAAGDQ